MESLQHQKILKAVISRGYQYDGVNGMIIGLKGRPLKLTKTGSQRYPTVAVSVPGLGKESYAEPAHVVAAYFIWGDQIFKKGVQVRHKYSNVFDIRAESLTL